MKIRTFLSGITLLFCTMANSPLRAQPPLLHQTSVGRFGAGNIITANTASQDLLVWNTVNTGKQIETRLYDATGTPLSLGFCGLPAQAETSVTNEVRDIGWTQLTCRYKTPDAALDVLESLLTPVLWFRTDSPDLRLFQPGNGPEAQRPRLEAILLPLAQGFRPLLATGYNAARDGKLTRPYFLALVRSGPCRFPILCLLERNPESLTTDAAEGVFLRWASPARHQVGILPLYGCAPAPPARTAGWERGISAAFVKRMDFLATGLLRIPVNLTETYVLTDKSVRVADTLQFAPFQDDWGWSRRAKNYALVPPALANARKYGYPVTFAQPITDLDYPTFLSSLCVAWDATRLTYDLPRPDLYGTLNTPFRDPIMEAALPEAARTTLRDYSAYVTKAYANKTDFMYDGSAIGEGRILSSEYSGYRMMDAAAREAFTRYADRAAREKLYNWDKCYGYGKDAANGRKFFLDNYRIGGQDYIDAGWFGYNVSAMWARAHYGGRWDEAKRNWPRIRELFYGWNWVYSDYAAMYAPLYVDGTHGGNPKGYTDNMGMLPALYAWARMAERLGDKATLRDALYMLARDRVARYNRMTVYAYSRAVGFDTEVNYLVSDMGNGPNIAPSGRFIPPESVRRKTDAVMDYGEAAPGLWFLSGSFFEPTTAETIDLMASGGMRPRVASSLALFDARFPRWYAAPDAGEMANHQIYVRGTLLHEDPALLRYYFDYQDGFLDGRWSAEPWHYDAFAGIVLSRFYGQEHRGDISLDSARRGAWTPVRDEAEWNLLVAEDGRRYLTLWNATNDPLPVRLRLNRENLSLSQTRNLRDAKSAKVIALSAQGEAALTLRPGVNLVSLPPSSPAAPPKSVQPVPPLPPVSARFEMTAAPIGRLPEIGGVTVYARNRTASPVTLSLAWSLDGKERERTPLTLTAKESQTWTLPLRIEDSPSGKLSSGKFDLEAQVSGAGAETQKRMRRIVRVAPPQGPEGKDTPIILYDFERDLEGWEMPAWPDANRDANGATYRPALVRDRASHGVSALRVPLRLSAGKESQGFVGVRANADWTLFQRVRVDVYLPADAPTGIFAKFYLMGNEWKWREARQEILLKPGQWTTVEADLRGGDATTLWNFDDAALTKALQNVLDFGIRLSNDRASHPGYSGPVYLDNFQADAP